MLRDLITLLKALISDLRAEHSDVNYFYIDERPKALGSKIRRFK